MNFRLLLTLALSGLLIFSAAAEITVGNLRCESQTNPLAIDVAPPRLSWTLSSAQRGAKQTAYQILVASSPAKLAAAQGDLWDSGRVASADSLGIAYAGKTLRPGQTAHWQVRVWDEAGKVSAGSAPASWEMGLLRSSDCCALRQS